MLVFTENLFYENGTVTNITDIKTNAHDAVRDTYYLCVVTRYRMLL